MTANRKVALGIAIGEYLSEEMSADAYEKMDIDEFSEVAVIWQPFEHWEYKDVCTQIEMLADVIEKTLNDKDIYPICDKAMRGEIVSDLIEHYNYTEEDANSWANDNGHKVVDSMWNDYSDYMSQNAEYKG